MKTGIGALAAALLLVVATGCQAPSDTAGPPVSGAPFPGESLVAPAIEPGFVTPEPTIEFDPG